MIYRHKLCKEGLVTSPKPGIDTLQDMMLYVQKTYKNNKCLGMPIKDETFDKESNKRNVEYQGYSFKTYHEVVEEAKSFGSGLKSMNLCPVNKDL